MPGLIFLTFYIGPPPSFSQLTASVCKTWKYISITDTNGFSQKRIGKNDFMVISDSAGIKTFHYSIQLENIEAKGQWELDDSTFVFYYEQYKTVTSGGVIRKFKILTLDTSNLSIQEVFPDRKTGLIFHFKKAGF